MTEPTQAFDRLHQASRAFPAPDAGRRQAWLDTLRALVLDNRNDIAAAISADFGGRPRPETELLEMVPLIGAIRHARTSLARWMRDERRPVALTFRPARAWIRYEPLGVVGIISPWNYPLLLALGPLTDALAAGNRAMLKPSELTPAFSDLLARLVAERFAPDEVAVATGGVEVAQAVAALPFDHLVFTGSTAVGRHVMRAAAENLTPVTLELGGKSPAIVCPGYDIEKAARSIAFGKFVNAGQTCIAPDYALVPSESVESFAHAVIAAATRSYPSIGTGDYGTIISERHRLRLIGAVDAARAAGATILTHPDAVPVEGKIAPTVVLGAQPDGVLITEEIFGPVLPVIGYDSLDEATSFVRQRNRPLALYCFSKHRRDVDRVLAGATSGGVTVNGTLLHVAQNDLPFGGIGPSGSGAYHGHDGFKRFSHARSVFQTGRVNLTELLGPPWGTLARAAGSLLMR